MKLYPLMINLDKRVVTVIGGGMVAFRKINDLLECGARVIVIAPDLINEIIDLQERYKDSLVIHKRMYQPGDIDNSVLVYSATDNRDVNREVFEEAEEKGILINVVDDPLNCSFHVPSWFSRGDLLVTISTSGAAPALAARIRRELENAVPGNIEEMLIAVKEMRTILKNDSDYVSLTFTERGNILKEIARDDDLLQKLIESYKNKEIKKFIQKFIR